MQGAGLSLDGRIAIFAVLGFLGLAFWLTYSSAARLEEHQPPYSSFTGDAAGVRAAYELLERRGNSMSRHILTEHEYPANSCVVLADESAINPFKMFVNPLDVKALELFMRDGGSLVLFCDLDMVFITELATMLKEQGASQGADEWTNASVALARSGSKGKQGGSMTWRGSGDGYIYDLEDDVPALLAGVGSLELADNWSSLELDCTPLLSLEDRSGGPIFDPLVSYRRFGKGELLIVNRPELITNSWIDRAGNHRLVLALIEGAARGRPILFDEHIHGFNAQRMTAGSLLTRTPGGHLVLLALLCIIFLYLGQAIMPARYHPRAAPARRQTAEMVLGQASLFKRAHLERGSLRHIVDGLKHELMKSHDFGSLPHDAELLEWAGRHMPHNWKMDPDLQSFLQSGDYRASVSSLQRASLSCDAMRMRIWQRPLG
jgi:hypothetical protein